MFDEDPETILRTVTPGDIVAHQKAFLAIAADIPDEYWSLKNLLVDLPGKWNLSFALWQKSLPVAYAILSQKSDNQIHLHHLMIDHRHRAKGWGARMITEMTTRARAAGATILTLKAARSNADALRFYSRNGFYQQGEDGNFVIMSIPINISSQPNVEDLCPK